ncbi:MAG: hypothetical protein EXR75_12730 [Myxococcales bacterium]|nr:hypothetical protein [Myxococcales bacterium]
MSRLPTQPTSRAAVALALGLSFGAMASYAAAKPASRKPTVNVAESKPSGRAKDGLRQLEIARPRVGLAAVLPELAETVGDVDLGPAPMPGGSRVMTREEILAALETAQIQGDFEIPAALRLVRAMTLLASAKLAELTREAVLDNRDTRGLTLKSVKAPARMKVATGWTRVTAKLARPPRKSGEWTTTVMLSFEGEEQLLARIAVPVVFDVSEELAQPDVKQGGPLTLIVKAGLIEIRAKGVAGANADVGDTLPVTLRPSGRVVRARLVSKDHATTEGVGS